MRSDTIMNILKSLERTTFRKMAGWPIVKSFVKRRKAFKRFKKFEKTELPALLTFVSEFQTFRAQQLPTLTQAILDVNGRQFAADNAVNNLVKSAPVALRKLSRESMDLRKQVETLRAARDNEASIC
jgi:hypothetical protein